MFKFIFHIFHILQQFLPQMRSIPSAAPTNFFAAIIVAVQYTCTRLRVVKFR